jgi:hypothetical protein
MSQQISVDLWLRFQFLKSVPRMGFEPTTPVFERAKTVHALDSVTTVIGP